MLSANYFNPVNSGSNKHAEKGPKERTERHDNTKTLRTLWPYLGVRYQKQFFIFEDHCQMRFVCSWPNKLQCLTHQLLGSSITPGRAELHSQPLSTSVHWTYRRRTTHAIRVMKCTPSYTQWTSSIINCIYRWNKQLSIGVCFVQIRSF